jgi:hypothetical protein
LRLSLSWGSISNVKPFQASYSLCTWHKVRKLLAIEDSITYNTIHTRDQSSRLLDTVVAVIKRDDSFMVISLSLYMSLEASQEGLASTD